MTNESQVIEKTRAAFESILDDAPLAPNWETATGQMLRLHPEDRHTNRLVLALSVAAVAVVAAVGVGAVVAVQSSDVASPPSTPATTTSAIAEVVPVVPSEPLPPGSGPRVQIVEKIGGRLCLLSQTPYSGSESCVLPAQMAIPDTLDVFPSIRTHYDSESDIEGTVAAIEIIGLVVAAADQVIIHFQNSITESVDLSSAVTAGFRPYVSIFEYPSSDAVLIEAYQDGLMIGAIDLQEMLEVEDLQNRRDTLLDMIGSRESDG